MTVLSNVVDRPAYVDEFMSGAMASSRILLISANDRAALQARVELYLAELRRRPHELADLAYTLFAGRKALPYRAAIVIPQLSEIDTALESQSGFSQLTAKPSCESPNVTFMFPGQGSHFLQMGAQLYDLHPEFRELFDKCDRLLQPKIQCSLRDLLYSVKTSDTENRTRQLTQTAIAQPALFVIEYALARVLMGYGVQPDALMGHSIGEFAAACVGGVFELEAALGLVAERGRLMQSMPSGSMLAVTASPEQAASLCNGSIEIAAHNAPELVVLSGPASEILKADTKARASGLETRTLRTSHAFHSHMMEPILESFARAVERAEPRAPAIPIVSTMTGALLGDDDAASAEYWTKQLRHPVRFSDAVQTACAGNETLLVEVGPGLALSTFASKHQSDAAKPLKVIETLGHPKAAAPAMNAVLRCLGHLWTQGLKLDGNTLYDGPSRRLLRLPTYPYSRRKHWIDPPAPTDGSSTPARAPSRPSAAASSFDTSAELALTPQARVLQELQALLQTRLGSDLSEEDLDKSLIELGFDSLAMSQLAGKMRQIFSVRVAVPRMFADLSTPVALAAHLASSQDLRIEEQSIKPLHRSASEEADDTPASEGSSQSPPADAVKSSPLTDSQKELWVATQMGGTASTLAYNECREFAFNGALDRHALLESIQALPDRHEALRHEFSSDGEYFSTLTSARIPLEEHDLRSLDSLEKEHKLKALADLQVSTPFNLEQAPLIRGDLVRVSDTETRLLLCAHHIVVDGTSWGILIGDLAALYTARVSDSPGSLAPAQSFSGYLQELATAEHAAGVRADDEYWLKELSGHCDDLELPLDKPRPAQRSLNSYRSDQSLSTALMDSVRALSRKLACTPQTILLAAFQTLIHRLSRQQDLIVGIPTSGQAAMGLEALVGHCVHVLPLRTYIDSTMSFGDHVRKVHESMMSALEHNRTTYTQLLSALDRPRDSSRPPLVQVAFGMGRSEKKPPFAGIEARVHVVPRVAEAFELYVYATEDEGALELSWSFNTGLFLPGTIETWQRCFEMLLCSVTAAHESSTLASLPIVSDFDRSRLLDLAEDDWVTTDSFEPVHLTISKCAAQQPDKIAVVDDSNSLTYAGIDAEANRIAHWLLGQELPQGALVSVHLDRSRDLVAVLLGVWRAGLGYVPLDPAYPQERIRVILEDSDTALVITSQSLRERLPESTTATCIEDIDLKACSTEAPSVSYGEQDTAYVIFTSGSTGRPKGVQIPQKAVANFIASMAAAPGFTASDCLLAITTISFDISVLELFLPLYCGGQVVVANRDQSGDPRALQSLIEEHNVSIMQATPATWQMLFDGGWSGNERLKVLCGGEAFPRHLAQRFLESCGETWNVYGPTETTVWSTAKQVTDSADLTIGRPIRNTRLYVLDDNRALVPPGAHGELWIGGDGVADGYLGRPELTADRFAPNPYSEADRIYRTGDLARVRQDGEFECLGRVDFQVKIRGFRIELGEIESALNEHDDVATAVVVAREDTPGDKRLVAYIVPQSTATPNMQTLRTMLMYKLPTYMLPSAIVTLDALPMTPNNKVDRKALPAPQDSNYVTSPASTDRAHEDIHDRVVADVTHFDIEAKIREVFLRQLGANHLGLNDDFFAAGGHSLLAVRAVNELSEAFGIELTVATLFENPTIEGFARAVAQQDGKLGDSVIQIHGAGAQTPFFFICGIALYQPLAQHLGQDYSSYGVYIAAEESFFAQHDSDESISVEELASHYTNAILSHPAAAGGQCVLGGVSFGGLLAFEVARQLQARMDVHGLVLMDTLLPGAKKRDVRATIAAHARKLRSYGISCYAKKLAQSVKKRFTRNGANGTQEQPLSNDELLWEAMNGKANMTYLGTGPEYDGRAIIVRAANAKMRDGFRVEPELGWKERLTGPVEIADSPGDHLGILRIPETADLIRRYLAD